MPISAIEAPACSSAESVPGSASSVGSPATTNGMSALRPLARSSSKMRSMRDIDAIVAARGSLPAEAAW